jgi:hypothetical protein
MTIDFGRWPARGGFAGWRRGFAAPAMPPLNQPQPIVGPRGGARGEGHPLPASAREGGPRGEAAAPRARQVLLLDSLERTVGGTEGESGADVVSRTWLEAVAAVPVSSAAELSKKWMEAFAAENDEEVETDSPDAAAAIASLIRLCQSALERHTEVVFAWYL